MDPIYAGPTDILQFQTRRKLVIEGHTDSIGRASFNQALSEFRAQAVRRILIEDFKVSAGKKKKNT